MYSRIVIAILSANSFRVIIVECLVVYHITTGGRIMFVMPHLTHNPKRKRVFGEDWGSEMWGKISNFAKTWKETPRICAYRK